MKIIAVLFVLLGVLAMISPDTLLKPQMDEFRARSVAVNFGIYRNAANEYSLSNPALPAGIAIPSSLLDLPSGWQPMRAWVCRLDGGNFYVWGPVKDAEAGEIMKIFKSSHAIGVKRNGALVTAHGIGIALPGFIPSGSIVSVIGR